MFGAKGMIVPTFVPHKTGSVHVTPRSALAMIASEMMVLLVDAVTGIRANNKPLSGHCRMRFPLPFDAPANVQPVGAVKILIALQVAPSAVTESWFVPSLTVAR